MKANSIKHILDQVSKGNLNVESALDQLKELPYKDLGHTKVDNHRELRTGYPEVIFCEGKTPEQVRSIMEYMNTSLSSVLSEEAVEEETARRSIGIYDYEKTIF